MNLLSSLLGSMANQASSYLTTGRAPRRMGNSHPSIAPYETLRCEDDVLALACGNDGQFRRLAEVLGVPELADDERFATNAERVRNRPELRAALERRLGTDTVTAWAARLTEVGVPAGPVGDLADGFKLAESLGLAPTVPVGDSPPQVRHPIGYSDTPVTRYSAPPWLGQHSDEIRRWLAEEKK